MPQKLTNPDAKTIDQAVVKTLGLLRDGKRRSAVIVIHLSDSAPMSEIGCLQRVEEVIGVNVVSGEKIHKAMTSISVNDQTTITLTFTRDASPQPIVA